MKRSLSVVASTLLLSFCTINFVQAQATLRLGGNSKVTNSIIFQNPDAIPVSEGVPISFSASDSILPTTGNNIYLPTTPFSNNFRIDASSLVFNRGNRSYLNASDTLDLDYNPRVACNEIDIGAYEYAVIPTEIVTQPVLADEVCEGTSVFLYVEAVGEGLSYQWQKNGENLTGYTDTVLAINNVSTANIGDYRVIVFGICCNDTSDIVRLDLVSEIDIDIAFTTDIATNKDCNNGNVRTDVVGGTPPYYFEWRNVLEDGVYSYGQHLMGAPAGAYNLLVTDSRGREETSQVVLRCEFERVMPSILVTPNNDGLNDNLYIKDIEFYPVNEVTIINSYGEEVITIKNYNNRDRVWDGRNRRGQALPDGTYYYIVVAEGVKPMAGWLIIRLSERR